MQLPGVCGVCGKAAKGLKTCWKCGANACTHCCDAKSGLCVRCKPKRFTESEPPEPSGGDFVGRRRAPA